VTAFMSTLQAAHGTAPDPPCGEFDIEAVAEDGTRRKVPLASATRTPFADMTRSAGSRPGRGSGTCRAAGGRLPMAGTWAMSTRDCWAIPDVAGQSDRDFRSILAWCWATGPSRRRTCRRVECAGRRASGLPVPVSRWCRRASRGCSKGCSRPRCDAAGHGSFRSRIRACEEGVQR